MEDNEALWRALGAAGVLKRIPRTGWVRVGVREPESVADHSFRTALAALLLAPEGVDWGRAVAMALLHDLPEAIIGDLVARTPGEREDKQRREAAAMEALLAGLPGEAALRDLWEDYRRGVSPEARLVTAVDKLDMALQALEEQQRCPGVDLMEFMASAEGRMTGPARAIFERAKAEMERLRQ